MTVLLACLAMTQPSTERQVIDAQVEGASLTDSADPVALAGEPGTAVRIMFVHGLVTGHGVCTCPVLDDHGNNVNPGRAPLDTRALGRAEGARKASETYARRRARKAADELAVIDPSLWDDETRRIVLTLATVAAPSRIDDLLAGELPVTLDELDALVARLDAEQCQRVEWCKVTGPHDAWQCSIAASVHDNGHDPYEYCEACHGYRSIDHAHVHANGADYHA